MVKSQSELDIGGRETCLPYPIQTHLIGSWGFIFQIEASSLFSYWTSAIWDNKLQRLENNLKKLHLHQCFLDSGIGLTFLDVYKCASFFLQEK